MAQNAPLNDGPLSQLVAQTCHSARPNVCNPELSIRQPLNVGT